MKNLFLVATIVSMICFSSCSSKAKEQTQANKTENHITVDDKNDLQTKFITFQGVNYYFRNAESGLNEYTPKGQEDMNKWVDWLALVSYNDIRTDKALSETASELRKNYEKQNGVTLQESTIPKTREQEAVHCIAAVFNTSDKIEVNFTRLQMKNGIGTATVYAHRFYGKDGKAGAMKWISAHGTTIEKNLIDSDF